MTEIGVISVITNVAPKAVADMVRLLLDGNAAEAKELKDALDPLFGLVTVSTRETTPYGEVVCRSRNPLAIKTLMAILGMPAGGCRRPLGRMSANGLDTVLDAARTVQNRNPEIFQPAAAFFNVDIEKRLKGIRVKSVIDEIRIFPVIVLPVGRHGSSGRRSPGILVV